MRKSNVRNRKFQKKPLYRKVNTLARGVHHRGGKEYKTTRHSRNARHNQTSLGPMHNKHRNGLDYTPLFMFLLSRVGEDWTETYREAAARLDRLDPIFWLVAHNEEEKQSLVGMGESSYYSGLYVDENNRLAIVDPTIRLEDLHPWCSCCTHTFNGRRFVNKYSWERHLEQNRRDEQDRLE